MLHIPTEPSRQQAGPTAPRSFDPREERYLTILLVARMITEAGDGICRIRNISSGGLMLETAAILTAGQRIRIELRNHRSVEGKVVWARAPRAGVQFDTPVDAEELLEAREARHRGAHAPRAPRLATECPVRVRADVGSTDALMVDISQCGAKLRLDRRFARDELVTLSIPGIGPVRAAVRWVREGEMGLMFLETISFADLGGWLQDQSVRPAARPVASG